MMGRGCQQNMTELSPTAKVNAAAGVAARLAEGDNLATGKLDQISLFSDGTDSPCRGCHSAAPPSTFSRCTNSDGERASAK